MARTRKCPRIIDRYQADVRIDDLRVSPWHPRGTDHLVNRETLDQIVSSIEQVGFFGAISITLTRDHTPLIEDGITRVCACHLLEHPIVPAMVAIYDPADEVTARMLGLTANACRHPMDLLELGHHARLGHDKDVPFDETYAAIESRSVELCVEAGQRVLSGDLAELHYLQFWQDHATVANAMDANALEYSEAELQKFSAGQASAIDSLFSIVGPHLDRLPPDELRAMVLPYLLSGKTGVPASVIFNVDGPLERLYAYGRRTGNFEPYLRARFSCHNGHTPPITEAAKDQPRTSVYVGHSGPLIWETDAPILLQLGMDPTRETYETEPPNKTNAALSLCRQLGITPPGTLTVGQAEQYRPPAILGDTEGPLVEPHGIGGPAAVLRSRAAERPENSRYTIEVTGGRASPDEMTQPVGTSLAAMSTRATESPNRGPTFAGLPQIESSTPAPSRPEVDTVIDRARLLLRTTASSSSLARLVAASASEASDGRPATVRLGRGASLEEVASLLRAYRIALINSRRRIRQLELLNVAIFGPSSVAARHLHALVLHQDRYREITPWSHDASDREYYSNPTAEQILSAPPASGVAYVVPAPDALPSSVALERLPVGAGQTN